MSNQQVVTRVNNMIINGSLYLPNNSDPMTHFLTFQTWTPTIIGGATSIAQIPGTTTSYSRIGDTVTLYLNLAVVKSGTDLVFTLGGLPYPADGNVGIGYGNGVMCVSAASANIDCQINLLKVGDPVDPVVIQVSCAASTTFTNAVTYYLRATLLYKAQDTQITPSFANLYTNKLVVSKSLTFNGESVVFPYIDWTSFTATVAGATSVAGTAAYRQIGKQMTIMFSLTVQMPAVGTGEFTIKGFPRYLRAATNTQNSNTVVCNTNITCLATMDSVSEGLICRPKNSALMTAATLYKGSITYQTF